MAVIRPSADLRNKYNEISRICHESKEPIYITKNGTNDLVVLSDETYEKLKKGLEKIEEEKIEKLIAKHFDKYYTNFEKFQKEILIKVEQALEDVKAGRYRKIENFCAEMEEKYDFNW